MALPCGSSTPSLGMTKTRAFILLHRFRCLEIAGAAFGQDAKTPRNLLIGLLDLAEIAAETVLVELFVGLEVPETAIVGADLVGQDESHLVVLVKESAKFYFKINQFYADPIKQA